MQLSWDLDGFGSFIFLGCDLIHELYILFSLVAFLYLIRTASQNNSSDTNPQNADLVSDAEEEPSVSKKKSPFDLRWDWKQT